MPPNTPTNNSPVTAPVMRQRLRNDAPAPQTKRSSSTKREKVVDIWGGKDFGFYQLLHYVCSAVGMTYYAVHFLMGRPLQERVFYHGSLEVLLLATRFTNELYFSKWGVGDVFHHIAGFVSFYLVNNVSSCREFGWAMCQMQVLHWPMLLWYLGCRRNCHATSKVITGPCTAAFPYVWIFSTAYRASIMISIAVACWAGENYVALFFIATFGLVLAYLDTTWSSYFLKELRWFSGASGTQQSLGMYLGVVTSCVMTLYFALLTK